MNNLHPNILLKNLVNQTIYKYYKIYFNKLYK
jgi:hypothetical protein